MAALKAKRPKSSKRSSPAEGRARCRYAAASGEEGAAVPGY